MAGIYHSDTKAVLLHKKALQVKAYEYSTAKKGKIQTGNQLPCFFFFISQTVHGYEPIENKNLINGKL